jgi:hypothetical protein
VDVDQVVFNGIDGVTGGYLSPPLTVKQMFDVLRGRPGMSGESDRTLARGADPRNLDQTGWGVLFAGDGDPAVREALEPLLARRREQAGERYRELRGATGYRKGLMTGTFFGDHKVDPGLVEPDKIPYYLLLVGSPAEIPYSFQHGLDVGYAVGRLSLDSPEEYAAYAAGVLAAETRRNQRPRRMTFLGVKHPEDRATEMSSDLLVAPLARELAARHGANGNGWEVRSHLGAEADHARFTAVLGGEETPAFAFSASHGLGYPSGHPGQEAYQGAFLCHEWPGPQAHCVRREHFFAAEDVGDDADVAGLVSFHFACYGAGCPERDDFAHRTEGEPRRLAPRPLVSRLPQRLLSHPRGGAQAVVGHVDRAWAYSFFWGSDPQIGVFRETMNDLLLGFPVGAAMEFFNRRYAQLSVLITSMIHEARYDREVDPAEVVSLWTANNDARSYVLLGDPAVRLAVGEA